MARRGRPPYPGLLTPREVEVLALLREGLTNEAIAERLGISLAGAKYHVSEILGKLGVETREEAALWSAEGGRPRPWWAGVVAPIAFAWRKAGSGPVAAAGAATVALLIVAGAGVIAWGLLRTSGGSASVSGVVAPTGTPLATAPAVVAATIAAATPTAEAPTATVAPIGTVGTACPGGPTIPASSTPLFAYAAPDNTIWVANADGTTRQQLICDATGAQNAAWSADGKFIAHAGSDGSLRILNVDSGQDTVADDGSAGGAGLASGGVGMQWSQVDDLLVYERSADIYANGHPIPTGIWSVRPGSLPSKIADTPGGAAFWLSPDGQRVAYGLSPPPSENTPTPSKVFHATSGGLFVVNIDGSNARRLTDALFVISSANAWSPDGRFLAYWKNVSGGSALSGDDYVMDVDSGREIPIGRLGGDEHDRWSADGNRYVFRNVAIDPDAGSATPVFDPAGSLIDWSPDGTMVAYVRYSTAPENRDHSLVVLNLDTGEQTTYETDAGELWVHQPGYHGAWSPDGRYYAFIAPTDPGPGALFVGDTHSGIANRALGGLHYEGTEVSYAPSGTRLLVQDYSSSPRGIWAGNADGSNMSKLADGQVLVSNGIALGWRPGQ